MSNYYIKHTSSVWGDKYSIYKKVSWWFDEFVSSHTTNQEAIIAISDIRFKEALQVQVQGKGKRKMRRQK